MSEKTAYEELLGELEVLAKAQDNDDAMIQAAAGEGEGEPDDDEEQQGAGEGEGEGEPDDDELMGKSFTAVIAGQEVEAIDGTGLVKALMTKIDDRESGFAKVMGAAVALIKSQGEQINLLKSEVARIGNEGRGRRSALTVHEKPAQSGIDTQPQLTAGELMAKANSAADAGRITWREAAQVDTALRLGQAPDSGLLSRIVQ